LSRCRISEASLVAASRTKSAERWLFELFGVGIECVFAAIKFRALINDAWIKLRE